MKHPKRGLRSWPLWVTAAVLLSLAATAGADLPCIECKAPPRTDAIDADELLGRVASTVLEDGLSFLLLGALAVVGAPWLVAAVAIAAVYFPRWLPRWLRVSR